ncbi:hypothetical protein GW17_00049924 [Ensete ventricosum]|nr:hypothetical protein GW17_00049924 [Ensete ventricosum]
MIRPTFSFRVVTKILLPRSPPMMAFRYLCHLIGSSFHTSSRTSRKRFPFSCSKRSSWIKFMFVVVVENSLVADSSVSFVSLVSSKFSETHTHIRNWKESTQRGSSHEHKRGLTQAVLSIGKITSGGRTASVPKARL